MVCLYVEQKKPQKPLFQDNVYIADAKVKQGI